MFRDFGAQRSTRNHRAYIATPHESSRLKLLWSKYGNVLMPAGNACRIAYTEPCPVQAVYSCIQALQLLYSCVTAV